MGQYSGVAKCGNDTVFGKLYAADKVRSCSGDVQNIAQKNGLCVCMLGLQEYSALSNGKGGQVMAKSLDCEGFDRFIAVECGVVVKDMSVCTGVVIAVVIVGNDSFEDREGSNDEFVVEVGVPQV